MLQRAATLDLRSLALCRFATGILILLDLASRVGSWRLHYSDQGVLPRQLLYEIRDFAFPGAYMMSGWDPYTLLLLATHALIAVSLALGYRTRLSCLLAWYFTVSIQERCFLANNGGDRVLSTLLFWGLFLPWGEVYSADAGSNKKREKVFSAVTLIVLLQPITMYLVSALHKVEPNWLRGDVLKFSFQSDLYARPLAMKLLNYPTLLEVLSYSTWAFEIVGPILLLLSSGRLRVFVCGCFIAMHLGFGLFLRIGIFALTPSLYFLALLPSLCWRSGPLAWLASKLERSPPKEVRPLNLTPRISALLLCLFLYTVAVSLSQDRRLRLEENSTFEAPARMLGLLGRWTVFVQSDQISDCWIVVEGNLADGRRVDLFQRNDPVNFSKPADPFGPWYGDRWATPLAIITEDSRFYGSLVKGLANQWEYEHPDDRVTWASLVIFFEQPTLDRQQLPARRIQAWEGYL